MNMMKTALLLAAMTAIFVVVGLALGGGTGAMIALLFALATNVYAYWNSDTLALRATGAVEVDERSAPDLVRMVADLSQRAGIPMPRVYIIENDQPNAFATGRNPEHGAVAVHTGLMRMLTREELTGVVAHELAHIKNRDTLIMTITATLAGAISAIAQFGMFFGGRRDNGLGLIGSLALMILAPLAAMIVQMAVSRSREYVADHEGGTICGNPLWLAGALARISNGVAAIPNPNAEAHPAMAHMFIVNPLTGGGMDNLFSTHPDPGNRIAALERLAQNMGISSMGGRSGLFEENPLRGGAASPNPWGQAARRGPWG